MTSSLGRDEEPTCSPVTCLEGRQIRPASRHLVKACSVSSSADPLPIRYVCCSLLWQSLAYFRVVSAPDLAGFRSASRIATPGIVRQHQVRRLRRCPIQACAASRLPKAGWVSPSSTPVPETAGKQGTVQVPGRCHVATQQISSLLRDYLPSTCAATLQRPLKTRSLFAWESNCIALPPQFLPTGTGNGIPLSIASSSNFS